MKPGAGVRIGLAALLVLAACEPPGYGRHTTDAAGSGSSDGPPAAIDAGADASPERVCDHGFRLDGHGTASSVSLTGDFVQWAADPGHGAVPFTLGVDGGWTGSYSFHAGTYQYKFIVDSQWIADPTNTNTVPDGFGGVNSVYSCAP